MNWKAGIGLLAVLFLSTGCEDYLRWLRGEHEGRACTEEWAPVCGEDGETYSNACFARAAGVRILHRGECDCGRGRCVMPEPGDCICPDVWDPVCDARGNVYGNPCEAECAGVHRYAFCGPHEGDAPPGGDDCGCPLLWEPVCGPDGAQYANRCFAFCEGVTDVVPCDDDDGGRDRSGGHRR